jgi:hypothetical protein
MIRVPVLDKNGKPLMPTKPSRARRWLKEGKAQVVHNDLNIFCIQLLVEASGSEQQPIALGLDPGKNFTGVGVQSAKFTLFMAHLILPFPDITKKMSGRLILRRARRGRRINRKVSFSQRAHRQKRFNNRKQNKLPPSIRANTEYKIMRSVRIGCLICRCPPSSLCYAKNWLKDATNQARNSSRHRSPRLRCGTPCGTS